MTLYFQKNKINSLKNDILKLQIHLEDEQIRNITLRNEIAEINNKHTKINERFRELSNKHENLESKYDNQIKENKSLYR